jgi:ribose transport system substrate-binding protein
MFRLGRASRPQRVVLMLIAAMLAATGITACANRGVAPGDKSQLRLGISVPTLDTPFFSVLIDNAEAEAKAVGGSVVQTANAERDSGKQVTDFRNLITAGANVILAGVVDREAIKPALDYAASKDVPVVIVDDAPADGEVYAVVKADNVGMGAAASDQLATLLGPEGGKVLSLDGGLETTNGRDRANGFKDQVEAKDYPFDVISQTADWDGPTSGNVMSTVLSQNSDLAGVYLATDTLYLSPVESALKARGRLVSTGKEGHIPMVAIDGGSGALDAIRKGTLDATISQPVDNYAKYGVRYLLQALEGTEMTEGPTDHNSEVIETEGYFLDQLPAPIVTKKNVDDTSLWGNAK